MKESNPLVSIITVTRNRAQLIGRCIESIQQQTYTNYEHIIVDGASEDNTKEVVGSYSNDERVVYIQLEENLSIPKTIWTGFEKSRGKYIAFLDDDDEYLPTKIEKQLSLMKSLPDGYGMVYCWMSYYDEITRKFLKIHNPTLRGFVAEDVVEKPTVSGTPTYFIKREVFKEVGGWKEASEIGIISDWELSARICQKWKVDFVEESLVNVYVNHKYIRMSQGIKYYNNDHHSRTIKFHLYFLFEFKNVFDKNPCKKHYHLYYISRAFYYSNNWKNGVRYQIKLLKLKFTFRNLIIPAKAFYNLVKINK